MCLLVMNEQVIDSRSAIMKLETRYIFLMLVFALFALMVSACAPEEPTPEPTPGPGAGHMPDEPFGITFASHWGRDNQVRRDPNIAKQIGADWDRWPLPWNVAEPNADGHFEWEASVGDDNVDWVCLPNCESTRPKAVNDNREYRPRQPVNESVLPGIVAEKDHV
jgi:hypothetical protein